MHFVCGAATVAWHDCLRAFYVKYVSCRCPVAPFPNPVVSSNPLDRLDSNRVDWANGRQTPQFTARVYFLFFAFILSLLIIVVAEMVQSKPNQTAEFRAASCELTCHFRVGRPFQRSFHSCAQFIYSNSLHTSKPDNTHTHSTQCHVCGEDEGVVEGGHLWRVLDSVSPS